MSEMMSDIRFCWREHLYSSSLLCINPHRYVRTLVTSIQDVGRLNLHPPGSQMGIKKHIRSIRAYPGRLVVLALA